MTGDALGVSTMAVRRHVTPTACDVRTRALLYSLPGALAGLVDGSA